MKLSLRVIRKPKNVFRVFRYATGDVIPEGAQFLSTDVAESYQLTTRDEPLVIDGKKKQSMQVQSKSGISRHASHYFLVECDPKGNPQDNSYLTYERTRD